MKACQYSLVIVLIAIFPVFVISNAPPLSISMSAQLADGDGNLINGSNPTTVTLKNSSDDILWEKTYTDMVFSNGSITFDIQGEDDHNTPVTAAMFDYSVVMTISTDLVTGPIVSDEIPISSQPYALISAVAKDTQRIGGTTVATTQPKAGDLLTFDGTDWKPIEVSDIIIPTMSSEVSGPLDKLTVKKILGKAIVSSKDNSDDIPTGAVLMYDPQMDSLMGAFHPSSGAPNDNDVLAWDETHRVWAPQPVSDQAADLTFTSLTIGDISTANNDVKLLVEGDTYVEGNGSFSGSLTISGGSDLSEGFHVTSDTPVEPGTVVSIDPEKIGKLMVSTKPYDRKVAGVVSGANGVKPGLIMTQAGTIADGEVPIALTGRVWVKCSNENGEVAVGDLLTTSMTPGHAMKSNLNQQGSLLGKAMSRCGDNGLVLALISLQ